MPSCLEPCESSPTNYINCAQAAVSLVAVALAIHASSPHTRRRRRLYLNNELVHFENKCYTQRDFAILFVPEREAIKKLNTLAAAGAVGAAKSAVIFYIHGTSQTS